MENSSCAVSLTGAVLVGNSTLGSPTIMHEIRSMWLCRHLVDICVPYDNSTVEHATGKVASESFISRILLIGLSDLLADSINDSTASMLVSLENTLCVHLFGRLRFDTNSSADRTASCPTRDWPLMCVHLGGEARPLVGRTADSTASSHARNSLVLCTHLKGLIQMDHR